MMDQLGSCAHFLILNQLSFGLLIAPFPQIDQADLLKALDSPSDWILNALHSPSDWIQSHPNAVE